MLTGPQISADSMPDTLSERLSATRSRIAHAAVQYGRAAESVRLLAVSKTQPPELIREMANHGQTEFGENYLQEALEKIEQLAELELTWHFIGQIQSNKTRPIAEHFDWVHTIDRARIAQRLNEQRPHYAAPLNVCIQVSLEDEPGKGGVTAQELNDLASVINELPRLQLRGLMCIPPPRDAFDEQRALFEHMFSLYEGLNRDGFQLDTLSMGMSGDLEAAIAAGSTLVRVGTALFGERTRKT